MQMIPPSSSKRKAYWLDNGPLWLLFGFTVVALVGFSLFALNPENLARIPGTFAGFFGVAYPFFAQVHVWLGGLVLAFFLVRKVSWKWVGAFIAVYVVSFLSEFVGTGYGLPFGPYEYTDLLGGKWFDRVPYLIPLSWFAMAIPSYALAQVAFPNQKGWWGRILLGAFLLTAWDLSLDPAMSFLTPYWLWGDPGVYYGMPFINLAGWFITGLVIMGLLYVLKADKWIARLSKRWLARYYIITLLMPLGMVLAAGLWGAVAATAVAMGIGIGIIYAGRKRNEPFPRIQGRGRLQPSSKESHSKLLDDYVGTGVLQAGSLNTWNYFSHHSKSFSFAAALFPAEERELVSGVYAFCRMTDDFVDEAQDEPIEQIEARLGLWMSITRAAYERQASGIPWLDEVMGASARAGVPFELIEELVEGVRMDLGQVALQTVDELNLYAYRVASVVGIWMCYLFGVKDAWTHERAAALGRAMQITNILRDVGEDLQNDRIYLPADLLQKHGITALDLTIMQVNGEILPAYRRLIDELMSMAEQHYEKAWAGIIELPESFGKVISVAAEVYRGIHRGILRNGYDNFHYRAYTSFREKTWLGLQGHLRLARRKRAHQRARQTILVPKRAPEAVHAGKPIGLLARFYALVHIIVLALVFVLPMNVSHAQSEAVEQLRSYYLQSAAEESYIAEAQAFIEQPTVFQEGESAIVEGYRGALIVMQAKHAFWPGKKMRYLNEGLPILDHLIAQDAEHVELRYLRLLSCYYLPRFLKRGWSVEEDLDALARLLPAVSSEYPPDLYQTMVRFVMESDTISDGDRAALNQALQVSLAQGDDVETKRNG